MINMNMSDDECLNVIDRKIYSQLANTSATTGGLRSLKQPTINENTKARPLL